MKVIAIVDDAYGMMFNKRRQSRDEKLCGKIETMVTNVPLWMNVYSYMLWKGSVANIHIAENFLCYAQKNEYCFVENEKLLPYIKEITEIILFHWNRKYASDFRLDIIPEEQGFVCTYTEDFAGSSHEKITMEKWEKR